MPHLGTEASQQEESSDPSVQPMTAIDEMIAHAQEITRIANIKPASRHINRTQMHNYEYHFYFFTSPSQKGRR